MMKYRMGEITARELREILPERPVVLLPLGSFEDQGPHAPMGDYLSAERMAELAAQQPGFLGVETARGADGFGITISYWSSLEAIAAWKRETEHQAAQNAGKNL